jgi:hypothetical protein
MKTSILALALALAFSLGATSAAALDDLAKCRVYNAKIKMNYAKCLELDKLLVEKGKAPKGICESKRTTSLDKATAKFVDKLGVSAEDCGIDSATTDEAQALQLLASSDDPLTTEQEAALAGTAADITSDNQSVCEDAGGTWDSGVCTASASCDCYLDACGVPNGDDSSCADACGVPNGDGSSCADACGVPNGDGSSCSNFELHRNGVTVLCPDAAVGDTGVVNGETYTKVDEAMLRSLASDLFGIPTVGGRAVAEGRVANGENLRHVCTSGITDMSDMFAYANFNDFLQDPQEIRGWDTSSVTNMNSMFSHSAGFDQSIGIWDTRRVTNMDYMFSFSSDFNQDLAAWCVGDIPSEPTGFHDADPTCVGGRCAEGLPSAGEPCAGAGDDASCDTQTGDGDGICDPCSIWDQPRPEWGSWGRPECLCEDSSVEGCECAKRDQLRNTRTDLPLGYGSASANQLPWCYDLNMGQLSDDGYACTDYYSEGGSGKVRFCVPDGTGAEAATFGDGRCDSTNYFRCD